MHRCGVAAAAVACERCERLTGRTEHVLYFHCVVASRFFPARSWLSWVNHVGRTAGCNCTGNKVQKCSAINCQITFKGKMRQSFSELVNRPVFFFCGFFGIIIFQNFLSEQPFPPLNFQAIYISSTTALQDSKRRRTGRVGGVGGF